MASSDCGSKSPFKLAKSGKPFFLQSQLGPVAHLQGGVAQDNAAITCWDKNTHGHQANLRWTIGHAPGGNFYIQSVVNPNFVFHQYGATNTNNGAISVWNKATHGHQGNLQVQFDHKGGDWWAIRFVHSGKCVHVYGNHTANGSAISQWDYVDQSNLKWRFVPVKPKKEWKRPEKFAKTGKKFYLQSALAPHAVAHLYGGVAKDNAEINIWDRRTHGHQANLQWTLSHGPNGTFYIQSAVDPNYVFHQYGATNDNNGAISVWNKNTHGHQGNLQVRFEKLGGGYWAIRFVHSGKCVHVYGAQTANQTKISQWDYVDQANLKWRLVPVKG